MLMEVQESKQRQTNVRMKQIELELMLFTLCDESFVFCDVAAEISAQVPGPRLWYDVRLQGLYVQGLYVGSAQLLELAYMWDPP